PVDPSQTLPTHRYPLQFGGVQRKVRLLQPLGKDPPLHRVFKRLDVAMFERMARTLSRLEAEGDQHFWIILPPFASPLSHCVEAPCPGQQSRYTHQDRDPSMRLSLLPSRILQLRESFGQRAGC